ncbi:MAG: 23S rRNA (guanosine(2251)-2'-O)-methyltransferase RlmB [Spirochaetota bacterium]
MEEKEIIFGRNPVLEYLKAGRQISGTLYVSENAHGKIIDVIREAAHSRKVKVQNCPKETLSRMHDGASHQGVILVIQSGETAVDYASLLKRTVSEKGVLVLLDQLTDPHNVGAIIRTAEALGALGVIMPKSHAPALGETIAKTSAGATAHIPVVLVPNAARFMDEAKDAGMWVIGSSDKADTEIAALSQIKPALLVIGSEGEGMRHLTAEKCDHIVKIPLKGKISSLNASVAAGILLYELLK